MWGTVITVLFFALLIYLGVQPHCEPLLVKQSHCPTKLGHFLLSPPNEIGDTLAGIAGALAFLWIIITVLLQSQELRAQRQELKAQRQELKLSRIEAETTNENMSVQTFENTFFSLLNTHNEIVNSLKNTNFGSIAQTGRACFKATYTGSLKNRWDHHKNHHPSEEIDRFYNQFWKHNRQDLGHYYRFLYRAFKLIDEHPHTKEYHSKTFRSQLSDYELLLLFYNCLSQRGAKFTPLAVKFHLFDNMPVEELLDQEHINLMPREAMGDNSYFEDKPS